MVSKYRNYLPSGTHPVSSTGREQKTKKSFNLLNLRASKSKKNDSN